MNKGIQQMAQPGGTPEQPQATVPVAAGELVTGNGNGRKPPRLTPDQWQAISTAYELLRTHQGRLTTEEYEVSTDDYGCVHLIIGTPQGT